MSSTSKLTLRPNALQHYISFYFKSLLQVIQIFFRSWCSLFAFCWTPCSLWNTFTNSQYILRIHICFCLESIHLRFVVPDFFLQPPFLQVRVEGTEIVGFSDVGRILRWEMHLLSCSHPPPSHFLCFWSLFLSSKTNKQSPFPPHQSTVSFLYTSPGINPPSAVPDCSWLRGVVIRAGYSRCLRSVERLVLYSFTVDFQRSIFYL